LKILKWGTLTVLLIGIIATSTLIFEQPRRFLVQVIGFNPVSVVLNQVIQLSLSPNNEECLLELAKQDVEFKPQSSFSEPLGCNVEYAVRLSRVGNMTLDNSPLLTCRMALKLAEFEQDTLQPLAQQTLGSSIKHLEHIGTYNCRSMRQYRGVLSQHAFANAIDISGFVLSDNRTINVANDWSGADDKSTFLKKLHKSSCRSFPVSVSPDGDVNHWNHIHLDAGLYRSCH
jgi:hypothetical protein